MHTTEGLDKQDIKIANRKMILSLMEEKSAVSRIELAKITNMSPTSMTRIIQELTDLGLVIPVEGVYSGVGRKSTMLSLNPDAFYVLGLNITMATVTFCIMNNNMEPIHYKSYKKDFQIYDTHVEAIDQCYEMYEEFKKEIELNAPFEFDKIKMLGISYPGTVDSETKRVLSTPGFKWKEGPEICNYFEKVFGLPLTIENDIKASIVNEYYRHPMHRADSIAFIAIDYGIGCAFMQNGVVLKGYHSGAGEIAHILLPDFSDKETYKKKIYARKLCYTDILDSIKESKGVSFESIKELNEAFTQGNKVATEVFNDLSHYLASLFNLVLCMYNPEKVILGGAVLHEAPILVDLALAHSEYYYKDIAENISFELTLEDKNEALLGGAVIAILNYRDELIKKHCMTDAD